MKKNSKNIIFILKTRNFKYDQRVHKEISLLLAQGHNVSLIVKSGDRINDRDFTDYNFIKKSKWEERKGILGRFQYVADLWFQILACARLIYSGFFSKGVTKKKTILWVCDPIMFPLVLIAKIFGYKVLWDHHELPPKRFLASNLSVSIFKHAYRKADLCIHVNERRLRYLEDVLGVSANQTLILSNLPILIEAREIRPSNLSSRFDDTVPFIYLQNGHSTERCGDEVLAALKELDVNVVCAGNLSPAECQLLIDKGKINKKRFYNVGYISQDEINWLLGRCYATIVLYKNTSLNQWYCDPNRLYQAMVVGTPIITASNPTIVSTLNEYNYEQSVVLDGDGSSVDELREAIVDLKEEVRVKGAVSGIKLWSSYSVDLASAISAI